jgi:hypothetical protein
LIFSFINLPLGRRADGTITRRLRKPLAEYARHHCPGKAIIGKIFNGYILSLPALTCAIPGYIFRFTHLQYPGSQACLTYFLPHHIIKRTGLQGAVNGRKKADDKRRLRLLTKREKNVVFPSLWLAAENQ